MISKKVIAVCAAVGVAFTGVSLAVPAVADPVAETYAIVGSDTLEDAVNAFTNGNTLNGIRTKSKGSTLGSFDATGSPCITTKTTLERMARPNGSTDGVAALSRSIDGAVWKSAFAGGTCDKNTTVANSTTIVDYVDIARSSSTPSGTSLYSGSDTAGTVDKTLAYIPFGRDAMGYAYTGTATGIATLTKTQLEDIFSCSNQLVGGVTITPVVPQDGSGTRSAWLTALFANKSYPAKSCWVIGQEHDGTSLTAANMVMPMSISRWIAMTNGVSLNKKGTASVAGVADVSAAPFNMVDGEAIANANYYYNDVWGRETWLVVNWNRTKFGHPAYDVALTRALDATISDSLANTEIPTVVGLETGGTLKAKFGIIPPKAGTIPLRAKLINNG